DSLLPATSLATADPPPREEIHSIAEALIHDTSTEDTAAFSEQLAALLGPDPPDAGMRSRDLRPLADAGMEVGFHPRSHDYLPALDDDSLARAMTDGRAELEQVVDR